MRAIDHLAAAIHPSSFSISRSGARATPPAPIATAMRERWRLHGCYGGKDGVGRVVPKGPLHNRLAREDHSASGDRLDTQFGSLALLDEPRLSTPVRLHVVSPKRFPIGRDPADAKPASVGIAPIAEDGSDFVFSASIRNSQSFLDARAASPGELAERSAATVRALLSAGADLVLLPELCVDEEAVRAVKTMLAADLPGGLQRLVALGSGPNGQCPETRLPFNECVVVDGAGRELWRQRKLHHFRMTPERMRECSLPLASDEPHAEDVATGRVLHVVDLPRFGRVIVLICEDLEQIEPAGRVVPPRSSSPEAPQLLR